MDSESTPKPKSFRSAEYSLEEWATIKPLRNRLRRITLWWFFSYVYLYGVALSLLFLASKHASIAAGVFILYALILLIIYFSNNKRNFRLLNFIHEYKNVKEVPLLVKSYKRVIRVQRMIFITDIFLWPVNIIPRIIYLMAVRIFVYKTNKMRRLIRKGKFVLKPDLDQIKEDPFYSFLMREGLYNPTPTDSPLTEDSFELEESSTSQELTE